MKISYKWLNEYLKLSESPNKLSVILTNLGLEVSNVERYKTAKSDLNGFVIGEVIKKEKHPNTDRLSVTKVDIGSGNLLTIVCGAPNVAEGQKVLVATVGSQIVKGDRTITLNRVEIRGVVSEGMLCAEDEVGLGTSHDGIMILDNEAKIGTPANDFFNVEEDTIIEIDITPNHADALSHLGVARELVAFFSQKKFIKLNIPDVSSFAIDNYNLPIEVIIENTDACKRYSGIALTGVTVKESPNWLKNRLLSIGQTPINNIVDITNYVLHECGQPLHAFDADKIVGNKVIVKTLPEGTSFITLDGKERKLTAYDLMICNAAKPMCIAGVFGGVDSGITTETKNVFLESAYFNPTYIRSTAKHHQLNTDASFRFERGTDINNTLYALKRAAMLIKQLAGGNIASNVIDVYPNPVIPKEIQVSFKNIKQVCDKKIPNKTIKTILTSLGFEYTNEQEKTITIKVPTYKNDITCEADIAEEILRHYGYNKIKTSNQIHSSLTYFSKPDNEILKNTISDYLCSIGFYEIMCNSLTNIKYYQEVNVKPISLVNAISPEHSVMRPSMLYGGLETIAYNLNRKLNNLKLFEFGNTYHYSNTISEYKTELDKYFERPHLAIWLCGNKTDISWNTQSVQVDIYFMKAIVENCLQKLGIKLLDINAISFANNQFSEGIDIKINSDNLVTFGKVSKSVLKKIDINTSVYFADFCWDVILKNVSAQTVKYVEVSKYPEVKRDLSLLLDKSITFEQIKKLSFNAEQKLLKQIVLFDVFEDEKLGTNKKSYAISFILQDCNATLTDAIIDNTMQKLITTFESQLNAQVRK